MLREGPFLVGHHELSGMGARRLLIDVLSFVLLEARVVSEAFERKPESVMSLTIDLTPDQEIRLHSAASRSGLSLKEYALQRLLADHADIKRPAPSGREFALSVGGLIPPDELDRMEKAIEEGCERIDPDE